MRLARSSDLRPPPGTWPRKSPWMRSRDVGSSRTERERQRGLCGLRYGATTAAAQPSRTLDPTTIPQYESPLVIPPAMRSTRRIVQHRRPVDHYEIAVRQLAPAPSNTIRTWSPPAGMSSSLGRGRPCCGLTARRSAPAGPYGCHFPGRRIGPGTERAPSPLAHVPRRGGGAAVEQ